MAEELSAAGSLLRVTCDAVIELDPKLCLTNHSPELSAMLLRDRPGSTLRGKSFLELMPPEEAIDVENSLKNVGKKSCFGDFCFCFCSGSVLILSSPDVQDAYANLMKVEGMADLIRKYLYEITIFQSLC